MLEVIQLVTAAYRALTDDPPARQRAERCIRRAVGVLSAVPPPHTPAAMRIADLLRETRLAADLPLARSQLLGANQALLGLSNELARQGRRVATEK